MSLRKEFDGENVHINVLAALTHLNEMIELKDDVTPLQFLQQAGNNTALDELYISAKTYFTNQTEVSKIDPAFTTKQNGLSLLFWAIACFQSEEVIAALIKNHKESVDEGYSANGCNKIKPLFYAMLIENIVAIKAMVTTIPSLIHQVNETGTPLALLATMKNNTRALQALYDANPVAIRIRNQSGLTPLHVAILEGQANIAHWLITHDTHNENETSLVNICDHNQRSPLTSAILRVPMNEDWWQIIDSLLTHGADCHLTTSETDTHPNKTALQIAHLLCESLRKIYVQSKAKEQELAAADPTHQPSKTFKELERQLAMADSVVFRCISYSKEINKNFNIAYQLLKYIDEREKQPEVITSKTMFGNSSFVTTIFSSAAKLADMVSIPTPYKRDEKINACRELIANIINCASKPFDQLPEAQQKILKQGTLAEITAPLRPAPELAAQPSSKRTGLGSSH